MKEYSLYIHIPFCIKKCLYCDFVSFDDERQSMTPYVDALIIELQSKAKRFSDVLIKTIYFGGGTPAILHDGSIATIMKAIKSNFNVCMDAEITLEANPKTITIDKADEYVRAGINRISIGLQSSDNDILRRLGRCYVVDDFRESVSIIKKAGLNNISVDVMYGLPGQTIKHHIDAIDLAIESDATHVSAYSLILEEGTAFYKMVNDKKLVLPNDDLVYEMFLAGKEELENHSFYRYEISNYAKQSFESKHNLTYWSNGFYLGAGVAAHSCVLEKGQISRIENTNSLYDYTKGWNSGISSAINCHTISKEESMFETIMLGLRLVDGISLSKFKERYKTDLLNVYGEQIKYLQNENMLNIRGDRLMPTPLGLDFHSLISIEFLPN